MSRIFQLCEMTPLNRACCRDPKRRAAVPFHLNLYWLALEGAKRRAVCTRACM